MAAWASVRCSAAFVYRDTSASVARPVMAAISFAVQPASASRRGAALRKPWVTQHLGKPAASILLAA
jgi:hypothetical protein